MALANDLESGRTPSPDFSDQVVSILLLGCVILLLWMFALLVAALAMSFWPLSASPAVTGSAGFAAG